MKSMTGYGRSKKSTPPKSPAAKSAAVKSSAVKPSARAMSSGFAEAWVRSVNGRFLEVRVHLPREWAELEPEIRKMAQGRLSRGTVDLHVNRVRGTSDQSHVEIDEKLAAEWVQALKKLAKATGLKGQEIPFEMIARAPDVVRVVSDFQMTDGEKALILNLAQEALVALDLEKSREGSAIQSELLELMSNLDEVVEKIEKLAEEAPEDLRSRLKSRMDRLGATGLKAPMEDDARFHHEVALLVDRGDIREEIARLKAHLKVYRELVAPSKKPPSTKVGGRGLIKNKAESDAGVTPIGKTLDFYAQELLREVNTVGSKSQTAELTRIVVEAKTLVEKIREQVQNVE
ncbi:MAG: DUF1732 domain-containing protein [Bdellovibrionales bacterium]|nr:DUF1732 domain-containing protein [Bdellovibrionales bacterium]